MNLNGQIRSARQLSPQRLRSLSLIAIILKLSMLRALAADAEGRVQFDIPPGSAQKSLLEFGYQSHLNVDFSADEVQGAYTNGVDGLMEPRGALSRLLRGSPLCPTFMTSGKSVSVTRCARSAERAAGSSSAESAPVGPSPLEQVLISGSNIHGVESPGVNVMSISRLNLMNLGIRTAAELIAQLPELGATPLGARADGNSGLGAAGNLRGQGADATLVLLNGHRLASSGVFGSFEDLANIPISAVERVDVVLDGASAQYGTDAVGGVLNIITLSDNQAPQFNAHLDEGLGARYQEAIMSQTTGHQWDSGVAVGAVEYIHATTWRGPNLELPQTESVVDRVPQKEFASAYAHALERLPPLRTELTAEGIYSHRRSGEGYDLVALPNAAVGQRTGVSVQMTYFSIVSKSAIGDDGVLMCSLNRGTETERQENWPIGPVEFTDGTTVAPTTVGAGSTWFQMFSRTDQLIAKFDQSIASYSAGTLKVLIGGEYRWQTLNTSLDSEGVPGSVSRYKREAYAGFGEVHIPIAGEGWSFRGLRQLELSIAGRYEEYSDFKGRYAPQYWLRWVPHLGFQVIGSWGRSSRAPTLANLDPSQNSIILAPVANGQSASTALVKTGNNSTLTGETSSSATLGVRFDWPFSNRSLLTTALSVFRIHFYDRIWAPDLGQVQLADPSYAPLVTRDLSPAQRQALCSSTQFFGNRSDCLTDQIVGLVDLTLHNIASLSTGGLEARSDWTGDFGGTRAEVDIGGAYYFEFAQRITPTAPTVSLLRTENSPAALQLSSRFALTFRDLEFGTLIHCLSGFSDQSTDPPHHVPTWTTFDVQVKYKSLGDLVVTLMLRNIFDKALPLLNDASVNQSYDLLSGLSVRRLITFGFQKNL